MRRYLRDLMRNAFWVIALSTVGIVGLGCGGEEATIGQLRYAVQLGDTIYGVKVAQVNTRRCLASVDGLSTNKYVENQTCPSGGYWLTRKVWDIKALEQWDLGGNFFYWQFKNRASGKCLKYVSGDYYYEYTCDTTDPFKFKTNDTWNDTLIRPKSADTYALREEYDSGHYYIGDVIYTSAPVWDLNTQ